MGPAWFHALLVAGLITLVGTPFLRRLALATGFVDHPIGAHKTHTTSTPYLGGVGLIVAVLAGLLFNSRLIPQVGAVALGGSVIGCLGLIDDHRSTGALFRFAIETVVAVVALAAGLRIHATDIVAVDAIMTIVWIVGVTNAVNLLDNMDGAAAGIAAAAATAIFAIAILGEQLATAILAASLVGACIGFLAHNTRPASIFMGDTGSLFLGFVLAVAALDMSPALDPPASFAVPLMLLALPVLDTATVTIARLRRGRAIALGGKDHLSHRLVQKGLSPGKAVLVLVGVEVAVGLLAVLAGRDVIPLPVAVAATCAVILLLVRATLDADVYPEDVVGLPRRLKVAALIGTGAVVLIASPAVLALARAHGPGVAGARATEQGLHALSAGDAVGATVHFDRASADLARADSLLGARLNSLGLAIPVLRANVATTRALVTAGRRVAGAGAELSSMVQASELPLHPGSNGAGEAQRLAPALASSASALQRSAAELAGYDRPYLWPSLGSIVRQLRPALMTAASDAAIAADVARQVPAMLGLDGSRRYFVAIQDNTELRGSGGVIRFWGELSAQGGHLSLTRFGPVDELNLAGAGRVLQMPEFLDRYRDFDVAHTWENVNVSPDFSVTGRAVSELYPQSGGAPVDGVVAIDLPGLASMLELSGPVRVDGWAEPLTARNVVDAIVRESFVHFPVTAQRHAFVGRVAEASLRAFTEADLGSPSRVASALAPAVRGGHVRLYVRDSGAQGMLEKLSITGDRRQSADSLLVVNQNLTATQVDSYLRREVDYAIRLEPGVREATVTGRLEVSLHNDAPSVGLPPGVIGPVDGRFTAGENRTYLYVYTPLSLVRATLDGRPTMIGSDRELGMQLYSTMVTVPSMQSRVVGMDLDGHVTTGADGWYRLDLLHQTSLLPGATTMSVSVPSGWRIVETRGLGIEQAGRASATLKHDAQVEIAVRVERTPWARLWADARQ